MLDEKLATRQKQLEELVEGITKYKGLSGNALTALKIDLLNEGGSKVNMSDEANATKYAYEVLDAKKVGRGRSGRWHPQPTPSHALACFASPPPTSPWPSPAT